MADFKEESYGKQKQLSKEKQEKYEPVSGRNISPEESVEYGVK